MQRIHHLVLVLAIALSVIPFLNAQEKEKPLRIGVVGLIHTHVHGILGRENFGDIEIVGIAESNMEVARRYSEQYGFSLDLVYPDMDRMIKETKPEAVAAFNTIHGHLEVVEKCAPLGIHVMVEKPLAVSLEHARRMAQLSEKHGVMVLTNYETTWYGSNHEAFRQIHELNAIGDIRKIVIHDGHRGPEEIGVTSEFLDWLTDPVLNGGGAITDFGCYGANLMTWLMKGQRPTSVVAITQQIKPEKYPNVDDEATFILTYPKAQGIIQASWNWSYHRKDMEVYGTIGRILCPDKTTMDLKMGDEAARITSVDPLKYPYGDPFSTFAALVRGKAQLEPFDLSSLENNLVVMEILDAGIRSAKTGERIDLEKSK